VIARPQVDGAHLGSVPVGTPARGGPRRDRRQSGSPDRVDHATAGSVADFAATLDTSAAGRIFCKCAQLDTDRVGFLRNEIRLNRHLPANLVPRLRWHVEAAGWLIAAFDHAPGVSADLSSSSSIRSPVFPPARCHSWAKLWRQR
jgi:hypothetical protein